MGGGSRGRQRLPSVAGAARRLGGTPPRRRGTSDSSVALVNGLFFFLLFAAPVAAEITFSLLLCLPCCGMIGCVKVLKLDPKRLRIVMGPKRSSEHYRGGRNLSVQCVHSIYIYYTYNKYIMIYYSIFLPTAT